MDQQLVARLQDNSAAGWCSRKSANRWKHSNNSNKHKTNYQVPVRVPVPVDVTVPGQMIPKRECETVDVESPVCNTYQETVQEEKTYDRCEMTKKEQCVTFEMPSFSIVGCGEYQYFFQT